MNYPAAELRGFKIKNLIALVADTLYNDDWIILVSKGALWRKKDDYGLKTLVPNI